MKRTMIALALLAGVAAVTVDAEQLRMRMSRPAGGGGGDTTPPVATITSPTSASTYNTSTTPLTTLAGTASDDVGVVSCSWSSSNGGSGSTTGTTSWSVPSIALVTDGNTVIEVVCVDAASNQGSDTLTVTHTTGGGEPPGEPNADITASSCSRNDVNTALTNATDANKDGWTVIQIPACSDTGWTSGISWTAPANTIIRGAGNIGTLGGGDVTNIVDNIASTSALLSITISPTGVFRLSGITIKGGSGALKDSGLLQFGGPGQMRMDHTHVNVQTYTSGSARGASKLFTQWSAVTGVLDNSILNLAGGSALYFYHGYSNGTSDASWTVPTNFGGSNFFYIEDSVINGSVAAGSPSRTSDCFSGGKSVMRFNTLYYSAGQEAHATGSTGDRGCRAFENYNNLYRKLAGQTGNAYVMLDGKVGGWLWWGNYAEDGAVNHGIQMRVTRSTNSTYNQGMPPNGFGYASGVPTTGTVNVASDGVSVTRVSGNNFNTSWPAGSMIFIVGASCPSGGEPGNSSSCKISSVSTTGALTLSTNTGGALSGATYYVGSPWDGNTDVYGYPALDQPGRGAGDLLTGAFPNRINNTTGTAAWPNQVLEPLYSWNNIAINQTGVMYNNQDTIRIQENRDYYPQASGQQTSPTSPFNGTSGTGWGTLANRPTTCTTGVGYFATDQGSWNTSTSNPYGVQRNGSDGVLYKCTNNPDPWTLYYTPYTYPHPLRGGS
jgi:hypothetical protein